MFPVTRPALNHYKSLHIPFRATQAEIKQAFRNLAKKFHPDQNPNNPEAEKKFREIKEAYETLSNKVKRSEYDREWLLSGKPVWNPTKESAGGSESAEEEVTTLNRGQLSIVYAAVIGLPFAASLFRNGQSSDAIQSASVGDSWNCSPPIPEISPRDELVRAFYNPITTRWERLDESFDPPTPAELFQYIVREKPFLYKQLIQSVRFP